MSAPPDDVPSRYRAEARGRGAVAVAHVVGDVIVSVFAGDAKKWSLPPFCLVMALAAAVLIRNPGGPQGQFTGTYILAGTAVLVAGSRALAIVGSERGRAAITVVSLTCVVAALVWTEHLRSHGEVDVTGRVAVAPRVPVSDGARIKLVIDDAPRRTRLRLTLAVEDAEPGAQSCTPETTLGVAVSGGGKRGAAEGFSGGEGVDLALGGPRGDVEATVTVHTEKGCLMNVSVATAVLHD
ncbi:hypothetical protein [Embleya scabrispora]|uniref:hypothetical protein n=1 Tax=Embleya scabrispora TaxID=159449 RepID=UPI000381ABA5|nr:hypothetical protein [Embleya scabrispora]MYS80521.1 hypothetical protein [Streptomyces sp. SID5474]